jgi:FkbM family methyltransferase
MNGIGRKLRPRKVRSALHRREFEWRLARLPIEPGPQAGQICYCIGDGGDITFDLELIRRYGAVVRAVDPVEAYEAWALAAAGDEPGFSFRRAAVTTTDGPVKMQSHHEPESRSLSAAGLYDSDDWTEVAGRRLTTLMQEFGDDHIDLLKLDVEGIEYELVPTLDLVALGVSVFAVQLSPHRHGGRGPEPDRHSEGAGVSAGGAAAGREADVHAAGCRA